MIVLILILLALCALFVGIIIAIFFASRGQRRLEDEIRNQVAGATQEALRNNSDQFLKLAAATFGKEQAEAKSGLSQTQQSIDSSMKQMAEKIERYARLVEEFEKDRGEKYGNLQTSLEDVIKRSGEVKQSTDRLSNILGNVKLRGQAGEWAAEDILRASGFVEDIHYRKNKQQEAIATRPDFEFLLPGQLKVCKDVKFPWDNYQAMVNAQDPEEKASFQAGFLRDVRNRIKELTKRDYINEQTLDYIILFIPNDSIHSFIQEVSPGIMIEAMKMKISLCSPANLYGVLAIMRQAYEQFHFKQRADEVLGMIQRFAQDFDKFKSRFEDLGGQLGKAMGKYEEITGTSYKNLDLRWRKIDEYRKGSTLLTNPQDEPIAVLPSSES